MIIISQNNILFSLLHLKNLIYLDFIYKKLKRHTPTIHPSASTPPMPRRKPPRRTATSWKSTTCRPSPRYSPTSATRARTTRPSLPRSSRRCADRDFSTTASHNPHSAPHPTRHGQASIHRDLPVSAIIGNSSRQQGCQG